MHVLVVKKEHIYFEEIEANYLDFSRLKDCYKDVSKFSIRGYVEELIKFSCKALKISMPKVIEEEINLIN